MKETKYLSWKEETVKDFSDDNIAEMYEDGFVFTRLGKGIIQQTRSVRIDLSMFDLSSENRRILKKTEGLNLSPVALPLESYNIKIGKLAKDFYDTKFEPGIMSAQKVKEMLTDQKASNFNLLLRYSIYAITPGGDKPSTASQTLIAATGYAICYSSPDMLHYSYPFYDLESPKDTGLGMMIRAVQYAKEAGMRYIYLGSLQRPTDTYKLQFSGLEWFDGKNWQTDVGPLKAILR